jgi:hypothetical protein
MTEPSTQDGPALTPDEGRLRRGLALYALALAALPLAFLLWKLSRIGHDFPYWDAWELLPLMQRWEAGVLGFADLWAQHNEHRILIPRAIMLSLAYATGWNTGFEVALGILCAGALVATLSAFALRAPADRALTPPWWVVPVFSFLIFSWTQMENWIWGWQFMVCLSTAAVGMGMVLLSGDAPWRFAAAVALGIVATFSFANGLLYWIAAAPVVLLAGALAPRVRLRRVLIWGGIGAACIIAYLIGYAKPEVTPSLGSVWQAPQLILGYVVLYLGAPLTALFTRPPWHGPLTFPVQIWMYLPGVIGLGAGAWLLVALWRARTVCATRLSPWLGLILFAGGSATVTAVGRAGYGLGQALTSAYIPISSLYWCGLVGLFALWLQPRQPLTLLPPVRIAALLGGAALGMLALLGSVAWSNRAWDDVARWRHMGWEAIRSGNLSPLLLQDVCHDPEKLRTEYLPWLAARGWAGLGAGAPPLAYTAQDYRDAVRGFIEGGQQGPARAYLDTAVFLDPAHPENQELLALGKARFQTPPTP